MEQKEILSKVDHTLLAQTATWEEIKVICDDAVAYQTASVCIPPSYVKQAAEYLGDKMPVCTVIGFPNGYNTTAVKVFETADAVKNGAEEIDMVINIGGVKDGDHDGVVRDIKMVREAAGSHTLKVIIETCLLSDEEKVFACKACMEAGADFVKTSTGFSTSGATVEDVRLMKQTVGDVCQVKAAGGVRCFDDLKAMIEAGADRIGTSSGVALLAGQEATGY